MPEIAHGQFAEGDQLELGIEERDLLRISFWTYGVPMMGLLVGALMGEVFDQPGVEWGQMLGGLTGLIFALIFVRRARLPNFINPDLHIKKQ
jgi:positive regulator of sigma E activity